MMGICRKAASAMPGTQFSIALPEVTQMAMGFFFFVHRPIATKAALRSSVIGCKRNLLPTSYKLCMMGALREPGQTTMSSML